RRPAPGGARRSSVPLLPASPGGTFPRACSGVRAGPRAVVAGHAPKPSASRPLPSSVTRRGVIVPCICNFIRAVHGGGVTYLLLLERVSLHYAAIVHLSRAFADVEGGSCIAWAIFAFGGRNPDSRFGRTRG